MVEKVLKNAVYEKSDFKLKLELDDIHTIVSKAINNIEMQVKRNEGLISKNLNATSTMFFVDKLHIFNVFLNILDNANKYSPEKPEINVSTLNDEKGIYISFKDKGIGISKESQRKIFEKFYRVPTGNIHDVKGFGLGLNYAFNIVKKHGGEITVLSEKNKGSEFIIFIPNNNI
ncbi:MAG: hypothetical protein A2265_03680 [Bacteroidetes bacterium RIFOXYA12_FULL_33_9]|nr:MAG: hypothetical protein A2265_03680 [Bacteroidetes bacterium RIFOXYA12_FULL_33_9]